MSISKQQMPSSCTLMQTITASCEHQFFVVVSVFSLECSMAKWFPFEGISSSYNIYTSQP